VRNMTHGDGIDNDCDELTDEEICGGTLNIGELTFVVCSWALKYHFRYHI